MMGPCGLYQHATERVPLLSEGYCTDDNARAVVVLLKLKRAIPESQHWLVDRLLSYCWNFVREAEDSQGNFYNFRDAGGAWLAHDQSEDMYARIMRACAAILAAGTVSDQQEAWRIFAALLRRAAGFTYVRSAAEALVACSELPSRLRGREEVRSAALRLVATMQVYWQQHASAAWPWFEPRLTYANALLPHGLLAARLLKLPLEEEMVRALHASTAFLLATTVRDHVFIPIGSSGWYSQGGSPSVDNQQPIEAGVTFDFLLAYQHSFASSVAPEVVAAPYLWFYGKNTHSQLLVVEEEGASFDGLFLNGPNRNCGAESMLAYLWAELRLREAPQKVAAYIAAERERLQMQGS